MPGDLRIIRHVGVNDVLELGHEDYQHKPDDGKDQDGSLEYSVEFEMHGFH